MNTWDHSYIAVAVHNEELAEQILSTGRNVLICSGQDPVLLDIASMKKIHISIADIGSFFNDLDIAEYIPEKGLYKIYDASSNDNAIITSKKCNSSCIMCPYADHYRMTAEYVEPDRILKMIEYISVYPEHLTITGGEPTLIGEKMNDIMALLKERFPETEYLFLTNGRIFSCDEYFEKFISVIPSRICFAVPLYGDTSGTHDAITRADGSFVQAVKGMRNFMNEGINVEIRIVVSKLNYGDLSNIARFIAKYLRQAFVVNFVGLEMCGNAARNRERVWIDYPEAFVCMREAIDILCAEGINVGIYNFPLCAVDKKYRFLCRCSISDYKIVYYDECEKCSLREICGGFFRSTYLLEKPEVKAVGIYD